MNLAGRSIRGASIETYCVAHGYDYTTIRTKLEAIQETNDLENSIEQCAKTLRNFENINKTVATNKPKYKYFSNNGTKEDLQNAITKLQMNNDVLFVAISRALEKLTAKKVDDAIKILNLAQSGKLEAC